MIDIEQVFLKNLANQEIEWEFQLIGRKKITGRVLFWMQTAEFIPITLTIQRSDTAEVVEIPWGSIQFIKTERLNNG